MPTDTASDVPATNEKNTSVTGEIGTPTPTTPSEGTEAEGASGPATGTTTTGSTPQQEISGSLLSQGTEPTGATGTDECTSGTTASSGATGSTPSGTTDSNLSNTAGSALGSAEQAAQSMGVQAAPSADAQTVPSTSSDTPMAVPSEEELADYTELEEAKKRIPADLSIFTPDSVAELNDVLEAIEDNLPASQQAQVDSWTEELDDATRGLVYARSTATVTSRAYDGTDQVVITDMQFGGVFYQDEVSADATGTIASANVGHYEAVDINPGDTFVPKGPDVDWYDFSFFEQGNAKGVPASFDITPVEAQLSISASEQVSAGKEFTVSVTLANDFDNEDGLPAADQIVITAQGATPKEGSAVMRVGNVYTQTFVADTDTQGSTILVSASVSDGATNYVASTTPASAEIPVADKADYSRIEAAKAAIPSDLSPFTEATVERMNEAFAEVDWALDATQQDQVNKWATNCEWCVEFLQYARTVCAPVTRPYDGTATVSAHLSPYKGTFLRDGIYADAPATLDSADAGHYDSVDIAPNTLVFGPKGEPGTDNYDVSGAIAAGATDLPASVDITPVAAQLSLTAPDTLTEDDEFQVSVTLENDFDNEAGLPAADQMSITATGATPKQGTAVTQQGNVYTATFVANADAADAGITVSAAVGPDATNYVESAAPVTAQVKVAYDAADYTAVDKALKSIPDDLTGYTDASVTALEKARNAVVTGLDRTHQDEVDAWAQAIEQAVSGLAAKPKPPVDPEEPEDPEKPEDPNKPENPDKPEEPSTPEDPSEPENPTKPGDQTKPDGTNKPADQETPDNQAKPNDDTDTDGAKDKDASKPTAQAIPKTGDDSPLDAAAALAALAGGSLAAGAGIALHTRKRTNER